jgi:hypothetical protein
VIRIGDVPFRQTFVLDFVREPGPFYITLLIDALSTWPRIARICSDQFFDGLIREIHANLWLICGKWQDLNPESSVACSPIRRRATLQVRYEQLGQNEKPPQNRNKSVHTNGAFAGWPGKHQDPIERHKLLGPDESSYAEHKVRLHDEAKDQIEIKLFHKVFPGGNPNFIT